MQNYNQCYIDAMKYTMQIVRVFLWKLYFLNNDHNNIYLGESSALVIVY